MTDPKTISRDTYLKTLAMFTMSNQLYVHAREMQLKMAEMLGLEDGSIVDDEIYSGDIATVRDFDSALKRQDITVEATVSPDPQ